MENSYVFESGDGYFELEKDLENEDVEEIVENLEERYGFEVDKSGGIYHLSNENVEISYAEGKASFRAEADVKPDEWLQEGIAAMLEGKNVPVDLDYFSEEETYLQVLDEMDYSVSLDRDEREYDEGVAIRTSPKT